MPHRIAVITDVYKPTINGVVTTYSEIKRLASLQGIELAIISPSTFPNVGFPAYLGFSIAAATQKRVLKTLKEIKPDYLHIATEGPLGFSARLLAHRLNLPFFSAVHTRMEVHVKAMLHIPYSWTNAYMDWFHKESQAVLVSPKSLQKELEDRGWNNVMPWKLGVNQATFHDQYQLQDQELYILYFGRISQEKGIRNFLNLRSPYRKIVVGPSAKLRSYRKQYPHIQFTGTKIGQELGEIIANAKAVVFPSKSDTQGLTIAEGLACGTPVAAYPVMGPNDIIINGVNGGLDDNLEIALETALTCKKNDCVTSVKDYTWEKTLEFFLAACKNVKTLPF